MAPTQERGVLTYGNDEGRMHPDPLYDRSWAIVIGINYDYDGSEHPHLQNARNDAEAVAEILEDIAAFDYVFLLRDQEATAAAILRWLRQELPRKTRPNDRVMFFFAGHGISQESRQGVTRGYLVPHGALRNAYADYIDMAEFHKACTLIPAKHILIVLDCCFSGVHAVASRATPGPPDHMDDAYLQRIASRTTWQIFTAGDSDDMAADSGTRPGHSAFTSALLEGLEGGADQNGDGYITATELANYVTPEVARQTDGGQCPVFRYLAGSKQGGDFIFVVPEIEPATDSSSEVSKMEPATESPPAIPQIEPATESHPEVPEVELVTESQPEVSQVEPATASPGEVPEVKLATDPQPEVPPEEGATESQPDVPRPIGHAEVLPQHSPPRESDSELELPPVPVTPPKPTLFRSDGTVIDPTMIHSSAGEGRIGIFTETSEIKVTPGSATVVPLIILNQGPVVDHFEVSVEGIPSDWVQSIPAPIQLMPGEQQDVALSIQPPRNPSSLVGAHAMTMKIASRDLPDQVASVQFQLDIEGYSQFSCEMLPERVRAGSSSRIIIRNEGNRKETFTVTWRDRGDEVEFRPSSQVRSTVPAGQTTSVSFKATPRRRPAPAEDTAHNFSAEVTAPTGETQRLNGELVVTKTAPSRLPLWLLALLAFACMSLVAVAALALGWTGSRSTGITKTMTPMRVDTSATEIAISAKVDATANAQAKMATAQAQRSNQATPEGTADGGFFGGEVIPEPAAQAETTTARAQQANQATVAAEMTRAAAQEKTATALAQQAAQATVAAGMTRAAAQVETATALAQQANPALARAQKIAAAAQAKTATALAQQAKTTTVVAAQPSFGPLIFGSGLDYHNERPTGVAEVFDYGVTELFACLEFENAPAPWNYEYTWYLNGEVVLEQVETVTRRMGTTCSGATNSSKPLPHGSYRVTVEINGEVLLTGICAIEPR